MIPNDTRQETCPLCGGPAEIESDCLAILITDGEDDTEFVIEYGALWRLEYCERCEVAYWIVVL